MSRLTEDCVTSHPSAANAVSDATHSPHGHRFTQSNSITARMDRADLPVRKLRVAEAGPDPWLRGLSAAQRMDMVWQISLQAWAFKEGLLDEPRLRRDAVRTVRGWC